MATLASTAALAPFQRLDGRVLIALDGSEYFCSRKIPCPHCATRRRADGGIEYCHAFLGASLVAPGHTQVLPLPPEFIAPQSLPRRRPGTAPKRRTASAMPSSAGSPPTVRPWPPTGRSISATISSRASRSGQALTCKPASHQTIAEYLTGVALAEHQHTVRQAGKRTTHICRWLYEVPLRASADALPSTGSPSRSATPAANEPITTAL